MVQNFHSMHEPMDLFPRTEAKGGGGVITFLLLWIAAGFPVALPVLRLTAVLRTTFTPGPPAYVSQGLGLQVCMTAPDLSCAGDKYYSNPTKS